MPTTTAADLAAAFAWKCEGAKQTGEEWWMRCPTHDDHTPSLSVTPKPDWIVVHCFAGCDTKGILDALGLTWTDLYVQPRSTKKWHDPWEDIGPIIGRYDYTDVSGTLLHQTVRFLKPDGTKDMRQHRPHPTKPGRWLRRVRDITQVLYHLPAVTRAIASGELVYLVEGEKDADSLEALGLTATTNPAGTGSWKSHYDETLRGAHLVCLPDFDPGGQQHMANVATRLHSIAASIKLLTDIHTAAAKSDVSDWLAEGHTRAELEAAVAGAGLWTPMPLTFRNAAPPSTNGTHPPAPPGSFDPDNLYTEHYNALALIKAHRNDMRYCFDWKCWMVWNGTHWLKDTSGQMMRWAKAAVKDLARLLPSLDDKQAFALLGHIKSSLATSKLKAMIESAQSEEGLQITPADFDTNHWLLTCTNGTVDLRLGTLRDASRHDFITKCIPITYASGATCPTWQTFLARIMKADTALVDFLQRAIGYSLTGDTREQCLFMLYGTGANGKSTFLDVVQSLLGVYAQSTPASTLLAKHGLDAVSNDIARLHGARFLSVTEISEGKRLNEALIKKLTGNDVLTGRFLYAEFFDFKGAFKIWIACNHKPMLEGTDYAMKRRIKVVPFEVTFKEDAEGELHQDKTLPAKLQTELSGILIWAIQGCLNWQSKGLDIPEKIKEESAEYFDSMDTISRFIKQMCIEPPEAPDFIKASSNLLYKAYQDWCKAHGEEEKSLKAFGASLTEHGCLRKHERSGWFWQKIGLRETPKDDEK